MRPYAMIPVRNEEKRVLHEKEGEAELFQEKQLSFGYSNPLYRSAI